MNWSMCRLKFQNTMTNKPDNDPSQWAERLAYVPDIERLPNGRIKITNVRDWTYTQDREVTNKGWKPEMIVDPKEITCIWFMQEPFPKWKGGAHTYLSVEFSNGTVLSFSVEARIKKGQKWSPWTGMTPVYPLVYTWGTERDFLTARLIRLNHSVYMYPLDVKPETAIGIFEALVAATEQNASESGYYNTLTANCTNMLAQIVNERFPGRLRPDISWVLAGTADYYLMKQGVIVVEGTPEETRKMHDLTPLKDEIIAIAEHSNHDFSKKLRALMRERQNRHPVI